MTVYFATPSEVLAPFIKRFWAIENILDKGDHCIQRIIPTGFSELMLYFTPRPKVLDYNKYLTDNAALYGQHNEYYDIELEGSLSVFSVVFQPQGVMQFFKFPLNEICNRNIPLHDASGPIAKELEQKMEEAGTFRKRVDIAENFFLGLLRNSFDNFGYRRMSHVIEMIRKRQGNISIDQMASEACLGRKQFERVFTGCIGTTPKQYLRIIRFQLAIFQKQLDDKLNMTELSYKCGYSDQAHFINEFKALSGLTPKMFFRENGACSDFFDETK